MVKLVEEFHEPDSSTINPAAWFQHISTNRKPQDIQLIKHAFTLAEFSGSTQATLMGGSCLQRGLSMADILDNLHLDPESLATAIIYPTVKFTDLNLEDVKEHLGTSIAASVNGVMQMDAIGKMYQHSAMHGHDSHQLDNVRKMLLAMVKDVRVVLIKLAERVCIMRDIQVFGESKQQQIASETRDIYAPLANRLGVAQIKWELEDLAFRYLEPITYKNIAKSLDQTRMQREGYIEEIVKTLEGAIAKAGIKQASVAGRVKHIYSIYRKMQRKKVDISQIYDASAVRVFVDSVEDCYAVLGFAHSLWQPIPEEYDDYIANPKPNGYRSLHTAVVGPGGHNVEVQIRTNTMHAEAELGVAAHWIYKEGGGARTSYDQKIAWLRQVIDWHKELTATEQASDLEKPAHAIVDDRVYVFTPNGDIMDLPQGATPLDFAYHVHTDIGHRTRGAKINGGIVSLTHALQTGERVEILTAKQPSPSRDWLNPNLGYLKTSRAKAKVHHWMKKQHYDENLILGKELFDREIKRLHIKSLELEKIAQRFNFKQTNDMYAALGAGDVRLGQLVHEIEAQQREQEKQEKAAVSSITLPPSKPKKTTAKGISIQGIGNLLTNIANCCKPVPGDSIVGYITQGRGVSIHRQDCNNILNASVAQKERLIEVNWGKQPGTFPVDIFVNAYDRQGLMRDITTVLSNEKINLISLNSAADKHEHTAHITLTCEIPDLSMLSRLLDRINQLPNVIQVERSK